jgi:hypothetical protein
MRRTALRIASLLRFCGHSTLIGLLATACAEPVGALAEPADWALVTPADDPWPGADADAPEGCPERAASPEDGFLEIDTKRCAWVTVTAPARRDLRTDDTITFLFLHAALVSDEPATATVGLLVDGAEAWRVELPVPSASGFFDVAIPSPVAVAAGAPLHLHVDNHGANAYRFGALHARGAR